MTLIQNYYTVFGCTELGLELNWIFNSKSMLERKWLPNRIQLFGCACNFLLESKGDTQFRFLFGCTNCAIELFAKFGQYKVVVFKSNLTHYRKEKNLTLGMLRDEEYKSCLFPQACLCYLCKLTVLFYVTLPCTNIQMPTSASAFSTGLVGSQIIM
jgi:hypothetical protein